MGIAVCPKCGSNMEAGFLVDSTQGGYSMEHWIEGVPEWSRWVGVKVGKRRKLRTRTDRCIKCGFLETYADLAPFK